MRPQRVYCASSRHCGLFDQVCDTRRNVCVDCVGDTDCPGEQRCILNRCATITLCTSSRSCNGLVCDTAAGRCVECVSSDDCADGQRCSNNACVAACNGGQGCPVAKPVCEPETELCVECTGDDDCAGDERCFESECLPRAPSDGGVEPTDSSAPLDAIAPADTFVPPPDAAVERDAAPPIDVFMPPPDTFVPPPDVPAPPRDVFVDTADPCSDATTCADCTRRAECGFCRATGVCSRGTSSGPNGSSCGTWSWVSSSCMPDAGPVDTGRPDTGPADTGPVDTGPVDTGTDDGTTDAGDRCAELEVCQACSGGCGFCVDTGRCVAGDDTGPATGSCVNWNTRTLMCRDYDVMNRCLKCYPDADGDGYPGMTVAMCVGTSTCPAGTMRARSDNKFDCADTDSNAYPGQTNYFETPVVGTTSSFDYNCDGIHGMRYPTSLVFCSNSGGRCTNNGWRNGGMIPPCGTSGTFGQCEGTACTARESPRVQACR